MHALLVQHQIDRNTRAAVEAAWMQHMAPAIEANAGHLFYAYTFRDDPDMIVAFQIYRSEADAQAFLASDAYAAYLAATRDLLRGEPEVSVLATHWIKGLARSTE